MLESLLDDQVFRIGVSAYLKRFAFTNAETDDLWTELQTVTQNTINVKKVKNEFLVRIQGVTDRTDFWNNFCSNQYLKIYNL